MAEKTPYPPQMPPPPGLQMPPPHQVPPPYGPMDPPPAYTAGGDGIQYSNYPPQQFPVGYQMAGGVITSPPTGMGGPPTVVTVVKVGQWGPYPVQVVCPQCSARIMTETAASPGLLTWLLSGALVFVGCWLGCCLIPCCIPECQDIEHRCPNCKVHLGTYRRI